MAKKNTFLKPSQALRIGMQKSRRCEGHMYLSGGHQGHAQTCALGAIALGLGFTKEELINGDNGEDNLYAGDIDSRLTKFVSHPVDGISDQICEIVIDLNDVQKWSRSRIGNWLKKIGL